MVEPFDLAALGPDDPESWRIIGDATRLAFADRGRYMADSDFVSIPKGLLNAGYLQSRSALLRRPTALPDDAVAAGSPPWDKAARLREYEEYRAARKDKHRVRGEEGVGGQSVANEGARLPFFPWRSPRHPRATRGARSLRGRRDAGKGAQGRG